MKYFFFFVTVVLFNSCEIEPNTESNKEDTSTDIFGNKVTIENPNKAYLLDSSEVYIKEFIEQHTKKTLYVSDEEVYTFEIHKAHLNKDTVEDAIITLNRLSFAQKKAEESGKPWKGEAIGYMGPFNAFFYFDGLSNKISNPTVVPSSPLVPLKVTFENISSIDYKDILIDYRIRNSSFKEVYFLMNKLPELVFEFTNFDGLGTPNEEAYTYSFKPGQGQFTKNIIITESKVKTIPKGEDLFTYEPTLLKTNRFVKEFFYIKSKGKYFTTKDN